MLRRMRQPTRALQSTLELSEEKRVTGSKAIPLKNVKTLYCSTVCPDDSCSSAKLANNLRNNLVDKFSVLEKVWIPESRELGFVTQAMLKLQKIGLQESVSVLFSVSHQRMRLLQRKGAQPHEYNLCPAGQSRGCTTALWKSRGKVCCGFTVYC